MRPRGATAFALLAAGLLAAPAAAAPALVSLRVFPTPASVAPGGAFAFGVVGTYADGSESDLTRKARFFASDPAVAVPLGKNVFGGGVLGACEIRATYGALASGQNALLRVSPIASLEIAPEEIGIRLGTRVLFGATATLADGTEDVEVTQLLDWGSLDRAVLTMGNGKKDKALSKALALGETTVVALDTRTGTSGTHPIEVVEHLESLFVTPESRVLQLGESRRFRAIGRFGNGSGVPVEADVSLDMRWSSSNRAVASLDKTGRTRLRGLGTTLIGAEDRRTKLSSSQSGGGAVLIVVGAVLSLTVEPAAASLAVGDDERFDAHAVFVGSGPGSFSWGRRVAWSSSAPAVATVDADGDVLCLAPGNATLVAADPTSTVTSTATGGDGVVSCF